MTDVGAIWSRGAQAGNDGRLHKLPAWCGRVVLPDGRNLDVVIAVKTEGNRGGIGELYGMEVFCKAFIEGSVGLPGVYHATQGAGANHS